MKWAMTTATYRFHLYAFADLAATAKRNGFESIELWEPHLLRHRQEIERCQEMEESIPIHVLSGYLDATDESVPTGMWCEHLEEKLSNCQALAIPILRLFTGNMPSTSATEKDWIRFIDRVNRAQELAEKYDMEIVFETHPGTLLDQEDAVERFLACIVYEQWTRIGLNFDAFHVWEFNADPTTCLMKWHPHIKHLHLKSARTRTEQFDFNNVYHPAGRFDDLCPIEEGVYDIRSILQFLTKNDYKGALTLEWFGLTSEQLFRNEIKRLKQHTSLTKEIFV